MQYITHDSFAIDQQHFIKHLHRSDTYSSGSEGRQQYIDASIPRLHRIFNHLLVCNQDLQFRGPTLDVASGWGIMYPLFASLMDNILPYHIAEMNDWNVTIDGNKITGCQFECDKDVLSFEDEYFGLICFFDCLEHLIVDPVWTLLEFNRVLRQGGRLAISTPNAAGAYKIKKILRGENPASESEIKPSSIYQRHNREWTPEEIKQVLECCGFGNIKISTNAFILKKWERTLLRLAHQVGLVSKTLDHFGPEIFVVAEKVEHRTLNSDLPKDQRWPEWLYTSFDSYRKRPKIFPIVRSDDYA